MKAVCMRYTRDSDQAMDVLQEGFLRVFNNLDKYTGVGTFEGWMRRIMVNLSIDRFDASKMILSCFTSKMILKTGEERPMTTRMIRMRERRFMTLRRSRSLMPCNN